MDVFSQWLDGLNAILTASFAFVENETMAITSGILTLAIMALGGQIMFGAGGIMGPTVKLALRGGATIALLTIGRGIGEWVTAGASQLGSSIGGAGSFNAFAGSPDEIYMLGITRMTELWSLANKACEISYMGCVGALGQYLPLSGAGLVVMASFFVIAFAVFSVTVIFKLGFVIGIVLMPFALLGGPLSFIGWPFFKFLTTFFVQIAVLSGVTAFGSQMFQNYVVGVTPGVDASLDVLTGSVLFLCVTLSSMLIAKALTGAVVGDHGMIARAAGTVSGHAQRALSMVNVGGRSHGGALGYQSSASGGSTTSNWTAGGAGDSWARTAGSINRGASSAEVSMPTPPGGWGGGRSGSGGVHARSTPPPPHSMPKR